MKKNILRGMLLVSVSALVACGGQESDDAAESPALNENAVAEAEGTEGDELVIPEAPANPLIAINAEKSEAYLAENKNIDGVEELESGLQIQTLTEGTGETTATENDYLRLHFKLSNLSDGELQDSRDLEENPIVVPSFNAIPLPGMAEALGQMKEGETAKVVVPPALAFGEQGLPGQVAPNETFIYELELIEVIPESETDRRAEIDAEQQRLAEEAQKEMEARQAEMREAFEKVATENLAASQDFLNEKKDVDGVQSTESGLLYQVVENGGEGVTPDEWDEVEVHYRGTLPDGTEFDSSYSRGEPTSFPLNRVIPGWTEGVALMNVGDKYRFFIPPELAYGEMGTQGGPIGPNQALVFDVELLNITENEPPEKVIPTPIEE